MKINRIKLRGFVGIKKGLGLDEIELNLSKISGLIALDGHNGAGKSTVLDSLQPYACLASRSSALYHHVFLRDSSRELDFLWQGKLYKTILKIDAESARSEGFIYLGESDHSEVKGKISEYKEYIERLFGSPNLFFNSVFCAQNAKKISELQTADLKALFSEFLRLDKLIAHEGTSKQCANILSGRLSQVERSICDVERDLAGYDGIDGRIRMAKKAIERTEHNKASARFTLESHQNDLQQIKSFSAGIEAHKQRWDELTDRHDEMIKDLEKDREGSEQALTALRNKSIGLRSELKAYKETLGRADEIRAAVTDHKERLETLNAMEEVTPRFHKAYTEASKKVQDLSYEIKKAQSDSLSLTKDSDLASIAMKIDTAREKTKDLNIKDPACHSTTCSFIVGALRAVEELPGLERKWEARNAEITERRKSIEEKLSRLESEYAYANTNEIGMGAGLNDHNDRIKEVKADISLLDPAVNQFPQLEIAEKLSADIDKRIKEVDSEGIAIRDAFVAREEQKLAEIKAMDVSIAELNEKLKNDPEKDIEELNKKIDFIEGQISDLDKHHTEKRAELTMLEKDLEAKAMAEKRLEIFRVDRQEIMKEISEWRYLQIGCSKTGLQALEIDSVAPVITGEANKLLLSSFGPQSTVRLKTLDDKGRECLEIEIIDEDGDRVLLSDRSGGQQVWVLKALRLGMAVISQEKSGLDFRTMFADEEDGKLDVKEESESALKFIQLYRSLITRGAVDDIFYITHKPECVAMADHVLNFNGGGVTIS